MTTPGYEAAVSSQLQEETVCSFCFTTTCFVLLWQLRLIFLSRGALPTGCQWGRAAPCRGGSPAQVRPAHPRPPAPPASHLLHRQHGPSGHEHQGTEHTDPSRDGDGAGRAEVPPREGVSGPGTWCCAGIAQQACRRGPRLRAGCLSHVDGQEQPQPVPTGRSAADVQSLHSIPARPPAPLISAVHLARPGAGLGAEAGNSRSPSSQREVLLTLRLHLRDRLFIQSCANSVGLETGLKPLRNRPPEPDTIAPSSLMPAWLGPEQGERQD